MVLCKVKVSCGDFELVGIAERARLLALAPDEDWPALRERAARRFGTVALREGPTPRLLTRAFRRYVRGDLAALGELEVDPGGTAFQRAIWDALRAIPAGEGRTYAEVARAVGRPSSIRAVAQAVAANPIQVVIPCHRVTAAGGRIPGEGAIAERRRRLLAHEGGCGTDA